MRKVSVCGVEGEERWMLDVCTGASLLRGEQRVLNKAVLMEKVQSKRLEEGEERDQT